MRRAGTVASVTSLQRLDPGRRSRLSAPAQDGRDMDAGPSRNGVADGVGPLRPPARLPLAPSPPRPGLGALVRPAAARAPRSRSPNSHGRGSPGSGARVGRLRHDYGPFGPLPTGLNQLLRPTDAADPQSRRRRHGGADQERPEGRLQLNGYEDTKETRRRDFLNPGAPGDQLANRGLDLTKTLLEGLEVKGTSEPRDRPEGSTDADEGSLPQRWASRASAWSGYLRNKVGFGQWGSFATRTGVRRTLEKPLNRTKRERLTAAILAARNSGRALEKLERDFEAPNSRKTKNAVRATVEAVIKEGLNQGQTQPASLQKLKLLAGCLKEAGYKSAGNYLAEYKLMHVEGGFNWSHQLQRCLQQCRRAADRARGPKRKAKEVRTFSEGGNFTVAKVRPTGRSSLPTAKQGFEFGVIWMLREAELSLVQKDHLTFDHEKRLTTFTLPKSKTDQEEETVTRVLQCLCDPEACKPDCPFLVSFTLCEEMTLAGVQRAGELRNGKLATKTQVVAQWRKLYGPEVSGHSARRTGALRLIRNGWSLSQVAFLGRWQSDVVYSYAAEALASLPVNNTQAFPNDGKKGERLTELLENQALTRTAQALTRTEQVKTYLLGELEAFKQDQTAVTRALQEEVEGLRTKERVNQGLIPTWVQSGQSRITHLTAPHAYCSPPALWKTLCGWHFHQANFVFLDDLGEAVQCQKCRELAPSKRG